MSDTDSSSSDSDVQKHTPENGTEKQMYAMYPEWGPASHDPENPHSHEAVQAALDLRDNGGPRPDDN